MRLVGMGLLAFLLAGIAIFLTRSGPVQHGIQALADAFGDPQLTFETAHKHPKTPIGNAQVISQWIAPQEPIILSGLPAYKGATFVLPTDARPTSGHLLLDVTAQVLTGVEGVLRVSIGNSRRGEVLLRPGVAGRSVRIDLTQEDLARERLVVSFSLQGDGTHIACSTDTGLEAVVEIETTSALFLTVDPTRLSTRDRVNLAGRRVNLHWPTGADARATALRAGMALHNSAWDVQFSSDPSALDPTVALTELPRPSAPTKPQFAWSKALAPTSDLFGLRRFQRTQTWRLRYDMLDGASPQLPASLELDMVLGRLPQEGVWQISVTLNGQLVDQAQPTPTSTELKHTIDVSRAPKTRDNILEITATVHTHNAQDCTRPPDVFAEITQNTKLVAGSNALHDPLLHLRSALSNSKPWHLTVDPTLTAPEASLALSLLSVLSPSTGATADGPKIHALPRGAALEHWQQRPTNHIWLVSFDDAGRAQAIPFSDHPDAETRAVTLLIDLSDTSP